MEIALLADGVSPKKLYPLDVDRAFKKLSSIKEHIVWWSGGDESERLLNSGKVTIGAFWNGRIKNVKKINKNVGVSWYQNILSAEALVVLKGTEHREAAMRFINVALGAKEQAEFAQKMNYAPVNTKAHQFMDDDFVKDLPDKHKKDQIIANLDYWAKHKMAIDSRWYLWQQNL